MTVSIWARNGYFLMKEGVYYALIATMHLPPYTFSAWSLCWDCGFGQTLSTKYEYLIEKNLLWFGLTILCNIHLISETTSISASVHYSKKTIMPSQPNARARWKYPLCRYRDPIEDDYCKLEWNCGSAMSKSYYGCEPRYKQVVQNWKVFQENTSEVRISIESVAYHRLNRGSV